MNDAEPINQQFQRLLSELQGMGAAATLSAADDPSYQQFIQRFPPSALSTLTLDEYCVGKGNRESFCWWLERGLESALGRYMPGTSRGHILYFLPDGTVYKNRALLELDDQQALTYTLAIQAAIAAAPANEDWRWVDDDGEVYRRAGVTPRVTIGDGRKLRLLSVYHPDDALPISSSAHLGHFLVKLGYPVATLPTEQQPVARMLLLREYWLLAQQTIAGLTTSAFMRGLYSPNLGLAPVKEEGSETELTITLTGGAIRNGYIRIIPKRQMLFRDEYIADDENAAATQFVLTLPDGKQIETCVLANRRRIKARFNSLFSQLQLVESDRVTLCRVEDGHFEMQVERRGATVPTQDSVPDSGNSAEKGITMTIPLNQILFGPPGTGKTYHTINEALAILDPEFLAEQSGQRDVLKKRFNELVNEGRVRFVTFHQSFSYEDFVEGLRADTDVSNGQIRYEVSDGVFKSLCEEARGRVGKTSVFDHALEQFQEKLDAAEGRIELKTIRGKVFEVGYDGGKTFRVFPRSTETVDPYYVASWDNVRKLFAGESKKSMYNPSYVEGMLRYLQAECGLPANAESGLNQDEAKPYVLIIDEINRGNISRIFGELITLIEPSKRTGADESLSVTLPYSKDPFSVPDNVCIIGTMNTTDRSLAGLDIALRRRFAFKEMPPRPELLDGVMVSGVDIGAMLRIMNQRITVLLDRDHCLGHAYFMPLAQEGGNTLGQLAGIFKQNIIPLLQEYFFEDWERIRWVLNDQSKAGADAFIVEDTSLALSELFPNVQNKLRPSVCWQLNPKAFFRVQAYAGIGGVMASASDPAEQE